MAKDYGIGQQIEEQEIDVYVPEYDVTVRATPAVSANVINNLAKMKVNGGQKGFNNVGGFEGTSVGDAIRSYVKRVSEEKSDLEPSWWSAYKGAWEGQIKGMARFPMDITAQVYDLYTSGANYMTEALYQNELKTKKQDLDYYNKRLNELENPSDRVKYQMYGDMQNTEDFEEKKQKSIKDYKEKIQSLQKEVENLESDNFRKYLLETQKERKKASDAYAEKIDEIVGMPKNDIASGMESVVTSLLLAPAGAVGLATTYGAAGAGDLLTEMKEQGVDNEKAFGWSTLGGILIGLANTIGDKFILTKAIENITAKSGLMAILKGATAGGTGEFIEEGSESLVTDIVKELSGIGDKSAGQVVVDAVLSGLLGFASGFVFGAGSSGVELKWKKEEYAKNVEKFKQAGISPETSEKIAQVIYDAQDANAMREEIAQLVTEDIDPSKYKDGDMQKDIDETVAILPEMMNRFLTQNEIEIPKAEVEKDENGKEKPLPEEKPVYTISGVDVSKDTMPQLHNLLYQAEASGNPITNIADALQRIDEVSGMKAKRKMRQQFEKVQKDIGKRLQARFGEAYGRSIGQLAAANIYAGAKLNGMSFDEYYKTMFPKINMNLKAVEELTETDNIPFQSERINTRIEKGGKRKEEQVKPIVEFNAVTFEDPENKENVKKAFLKNGFTEKAADDAIENLQRVVDFAKQLGEESERLREQNERKAYIEQRPTEDVAKYEPEEMSLVVQGDKMALGLVPRVSVFVKNGEYQYNIDFGTTCTRREPLEAAIRVMIDMGQAKNLGLSQINNIKDILGKYGFTKPCVLCFVEGKRTYELISANRLSRQWNVVLNSLGIDDGKVIGTERTMSEELLKRLKEMESGKGYEKYVDKQYRDKSDKDPVGLTKARAKAIAKIMLSEFERTGKSTLTNRMRPDMLMNSRGTDYLFRKYVKDAPTLKGLIAARDGAGTPKPHTSYPVYDSKSWKEIFDMKKNVEKEVKHLFDIGGVRLQSFSDFNEYMVIDYLQAMLDLSARGLPAHAYTKVTSFVELFGEMLNINMSLIGNSSRDIPVEYDGLKPAGKGDRVVFEDENGKWTYNWATESFDPQKAFELRKEDRFKGKVGTVGIGISDNQIMAMLNDPEIDMIIPFHKSGIQDHILISAGLKRADGTSVKDYSDYQNTGGKKKKAPDYLFNEHMQELKDAKKVAKDYLRWCKEKGYTPKFEQFSKHENYYKLLEDFRTYDNNGKPVVQKAVEFKLGDNFNDTLKEAIRNRDEVVGAISKIQENKALMADLEEAVRFAHLDGELKKVTLGKIEKAIGGNDNLKVLSQEDMFDELSKTDPDKAQKYRDGSGILYGFAKEGKIYLNVQGFNAHTPVHEYAHLWARVVQSTNENLWKRGVSLLKQTEKWKELEQDEQYKEILKNEDMFASEVFARIVGEYNEDIAKYLQDPDRPEYKNDSLKNKILQFIRDVFGYIRSMFDKNFKPDDVKSAKDFATMSLLDLYDDARATELAKRMREMRKKGEFSISRDMLNNPMFQSGFVSMRNALVGTQLDADAHYGEGEHGNMAHGWGNYLLLDRKKNKKRYFDKWNETHTKSTYEGMALEDVFAEKGGRFGILVGEVINKAKYYAMEEKSSEVTTKHFTEAINKTLQKYDEEGFSIKQEIKYEKEMDAKGLQNKVEYLEGVLEQNEERISILKSLDPSKMKVDVIGGTAEQHEFEIPELKDLMTEHRVIRMQGENIQKAILKLVDMLPDEALDLDNQTREDWKDWFRNATGRKVYGTLARMSGFDVEREQAKAFRWASKQLESVGIKGIYYEGGLDGEGVVIFNKEDTRHIRRLLQENGQVVRGAYDQDTNMMYLFETANRSTFLHEMAHAWMNIVINGKTEQAKAVKKAIDEFVGNKGEPYTREQLEKFARGFEQYCSEGVAPNNFLKNAFRNFKNWLISLWKTAKGTGVELNDEIRQVYKDMLGGNDVDAVFSDDMDFKEIEDMVAKIEEYEAKQKEERAKLVLEMAEKIRPESSWANVKDWGNNLLESAGDLPKDILQSSYERLAKIDRKLGLLIQRAEQSQGLRIKRWTEQIKPFYEAFNNLSAEDKAKVQFYLLNQQWGAVEALIGQENTDAVRRMLKTIYDELIASGVEVGYRSNYFPRSVLDYDGLLQEMGLTYPQIRKEMEEAIGKDATPEEQAEWFDKHIMGFSGGNVSTKGNKYTKERKLDLITDKMAQYYRPSMETLINYVEGMAKLLSMREVFGKDYNSKESVGDAIERLLNEKNLSKKDIDEVRKVLSALYLPNGMGNKFLQAMRQYGYATKLSYSTTIRQFADIGMMMKVNGVLNTLDALFHPDKRITLENLGIDPLGEEFNTSKKDIGGKVANFFTKWKGINWADAIMKNAFMRGNYKDLQKLAKNPEKFHEKYDSLFGDETDTLIKDLNDNKVSEPVKVLLFHEISKIQPISRSAMPTAYLSNPNGRVFYMFKTFSLHRAEYMVSELANDFRNGDYKKAGKDIMADVAVIGWEGLVELLIAFLKYGWQAFATKEVLDTFAGAGLGVIGLNKHQALQLTRGQVDDFFQQMIGLGTPIDDIFDLMRHYDEDDKLLRAFLPDMILEPLIAGPKQIGKKKKKVK